MYTDGSSIGNPGPGGIGFIIINKYNNYKKEYSYKFRYTTNNRMELYAIIYSIKIINKYNYIYTNIYSDSKYIIDSINKNYKKKKNNDLWIKFYKLKNDKIKFYWIKGHNNNYYNEKCNILAKKAINNYKTLIDYNYEKNLK
ncbi:MAG: reverse transcriptase-like protein [Candidatus Shikimatogenerans sp. JK-2022]|nr:reverse transcriptase-like protein [Candidatus Shikimatogenerans bostrichidophilus]